MKRYLLISALSLLICAPAGAVSLDRFEISAAFSPPHNEPVVQDFVARYKIEADGSVRFWKRVTADLNVKAWGLQDWRTPEQVGHGFPDAWRGSDWGVKTIRLDYTAKIGVDVYGPVQLFVEHQKWGYVSSVLPSSHISEYYWLTGVRWRMK
jgi:hypothetical protein